MITFSELGDAGGYEKLSPTTATGITTSVKRPTSGIYKGLTAKAALIVIETNAIRFREDGTDASATAGMRMEAGQNFTVTGQANVQRFSCIDTADGASAVHVHTYF